MRTALVPETVTLKDDRDGTSSAYSFYQYACAVWLDDVLWQSPKINLASLIKIIPEVKKPVGETMRFEDADWALLCRVIQNPQLGPSGQPVYGIRPTLVLQLMAYERAILDAVAE